MLCLIPTFPLLCVYLILDLSSLIMFNPSLNRWIMILRLHLIQPYLLLQSMILHPSRSMLDSLRLSFLERGKHLHKLLRIMPMLRTKLWSDTSLETSVKKKFTWWEPPKKSTPLSSLIALSSDSNESSDEFLRKLNEEVINQKGEKK